MNEDKNKTCRDTRQKSNKKSQRKMFQSLSQGFGNVIVLYYITNFWLEVSWQNDLFRALSEIMNVKKTKTLRVLKFY